MKQFIIPLALALTAATGSIVFTVDAAIAGPTYTGVEDGNVAVSGYDVTSYFTNKGIPVKGSKANRVQYKGADYYFSNVSNAEKFKANPAKYAPQYGGHCAWALSRGSLAPGNPLNYKVVNGKLYLNFNSQVQKTWLTDIPGFISKSEIKWPTIPDTAKFGG